MGVAFFLPLPAEERLRARGLGCLAPLVGPLVGPLAAPLAEPLASATGADDESYLSSLPAEVTLAA